jgi:hypothetical protein
MYLYLFKVIKRGNRLRLHDAKIIIGFCRLVEISWQNKVSIFKSCLSTFVNEVVRHVGY